MSDAQAAEYGRQIARWFRLYREGRITFRTFLVVGSTLYTEFNPSYNEEHGGAE